MNLETLLKEPLSRRSFLAGMVSATVLRGRVLAQTSSQCSRAVLPLNITSRRKYGKGIVFQSSQIILPYFNGTAHIEWPDGYARDVTLNAYPIALPQASRDLKLIRVDLLDEKVKDSSLLPPSTFTPSYELIGPYPYHYLKGFTYPSEDGWMSFLRMTIPEHVLKGPYPAVSNTLLTLEDKGRLISYLNTIFVFPMSHYYGFNDPFQALYVKRKEKDVFEVIGLYDKHVGEHGSVLFQTPDVSDAHILSTTYTTLEDVFLDKPPVEEENIPSFIGEQYGLLDAPLPLTIVRFKPEKERVRIRTSQLDDFPFDLAWEVNLSSLPEGGAYLPMRGKDPFKGKTVRTSFSRLGPLERSLLFAAAEDLLHKPGCPNVLIKYESGFKGREAVDIL